MSISFWCCHAHNLGIKLYVGSEMVPYLLLFVFHNSSNFGLGALPELLDRCGRKHETNPTGEQRHRCLEKASYR